MKIEKRNELMHLSVDAISPNPENPRLIFDQEKLDILAESISEVGILVPLIVFEEEDGKYLLLDGERRWMCAKRLNLKDIPANVIAKPNKIENILRMFNIHNVREDWELMPTALKLGDLINELGITNERRLNELISLSIGMIRRCKTVLSLPRKYQKGILNREFKADFFIEMDAKALRKLEKVLPNFYKKYGKEKLINLFVSMLKNGKIKSVTDFRFLQKMLDAKNLGLSSKVIEDLVKRIVVRQEMGFREAYGLVEDLINVSKVEEKAARLSETFRSLKYDALKKKEKDKLRAVLLDLRDTINRILRNL